MYQVKERLERRGEGLATPKRSCPRLIHDSHRGGETRKKVERRLSKRGWEICGKMHAQDLQVTSSCLTSAEEMHDVLRAAPYQAQVPAPGKGRETRVKSHRVALNVPRYMCH